MKPDHQSLAVRQLSLGPDRCVFDLFPPMVRGVDDQEGPFQFPLEVEFDYSRLNPEIFDDRSSTSMLRWRQLLPPIAPGLSMAEGGTPLMAIDGGCERNSVRLYLKDESRNPTLSHKDRLNICAVSAAKLSGATGVIAASTGNHGISTAAYSARANLPCVILVPDRFSTGYAAALRAYGAFAVPVNPANRFQIMSDLVARAGFHPTSNLTRFHTGHPFGPEGYKTISFELYQELGKAPDAIVVPTGYAELLFGIVKGFKELQNAGRVEKVPKVYSVEPQGLAPLAKAWREHLPMAAVAPVPTPLTSIACTVSGYRGVWALANSGSNNSLANSWGESLTVSDEATLEAQSQLAKKGHWLEISSASALAAVNAFADHFDDQDVVLIGTSSGVKDPLSFTSTKSVCEGVQDVADYLSTEYGWSIE